MMLDTQDVSSIEEVYPREPWAIPEVPETTTDRPADADWLKGAEVNTVVKARRLPGCSIRVVRDWLRLLCPKGAVFTNLANGGQLGKDYFTAGGIFQSSLTVHMYKGSDMQMPLAGTAVGVFKFSWPTNQSRPTNISVELTE